MNEAEIEVELRDSPGELVRILEAVAAEQGNVVTIVHDRAHVVRGRVPVRIQIQVEPGRLAGIGKRLEEQGITVRGIELERDHGKQVVIIVGHVFRTDIKDTMDIVREPGTLIRWVDSRLTDERSVSTVKFVLQGSPEQLKASRELLAQVCERKDLLLVGEAQ